MSLVRIPFYSNKFFALLKYYKKKITFVSYFLQLERTRALKGHVPPSLGQKRHQRVQCGAQTSKDSGRTCDFDLSVQITKLP